MLNRSIKFLIENKLVAFLLLLLLLSWGMYNSPFDFGKKYFPSNPVSVDAIPDTGENQQIVYCAWPGKSPQDIEDQITYPLTANLLGIPGVKTIRSSSMFGFSSLYVIFEENVEFYWGRSRILEKISSLPSNLLPEGVKPILGPDANSLGQIYWYTIEGRDDDGKVTGGWDLHEIRKVQDFHIKNSLSSVKGVAEVSSIGGYVQEYQIDIDPDLMKKNGVTLQQVVSSIKDNNKDVGAKTIEINQVEYFVRGLGFIKNIEEIENIAVAINNYTPILIKDIARVNLGPEERRGILDKEGAEVVGGIVVSRYGANPMQVINGVNEKINEISSGMPSKILKDGRKSKLTIIPFYDRTQLIKETISTLGDALYFEILITMLVVVVMLYRLRVALLISAIMPIAVLSVFVVMKFFNIEANIVALSGIAIAIGTMVDMGIILTENILRHLNDNKSSGNIDKLVYNASTEVSGAIVTAAMTTIVSFIPVFVLTGAEGKLFTPVAITKTVAIFSSLIIALFLIPPFAAILLRKRKLNIKIAILGYSMFIVLGITTFYWSSILAFLLIGIGVISVLKRLKKVSKSNSRIASFSLVVATILLLLTVHWRPLGFGAATFWNFLIVVLICSIVLGGIFYFKHKYFDILKWALQNKLTFLSIPAVIFVLGLLIAFNTGKEFMPSLDEGSFLIMPTTLPHAGVSQNKKILTQLDIAVANLPEIKSVVGKAGRSDSPLDPAPLSMFENIIFYKPEYILDKDNRPIKFKTNQEGLFILKSGGSVTFGAGVNEDDLIKDSNGEFYRNWRTEIKSKDDIWEAIIKQTTLPGVTISPRLQPIETRMVMLQSGISANMGIKIKGRDIKEIEQFGLQLEKVLENVDGVNNSTIYAEKITAKPYLEIDIDRAAIARYGLTIEAVQEVIEIAVGGKVLTSVIDGQERYGIRVRYPRELRTSPEDLGKVYIQLKNGNSIPLDQLAKIQFERGPKNIKSEDGYHVGYVLFDKKNKLSEIDVIEEARKVIENRITTQDLIVPEGVSYKFVGNYENQLHAEQTLLFIVPMVLILIFLILYFQFRSVATTFMVFIGVSVVFAGGFIMIWLFGQSWFMNFSIGDIDFRTLFNIKTVYLSVAIWIGFIALFGIATDDGVVIATYLKQVFSVNNPNSIEEIRQSVIEACSKRIRPCLMTTATTILALLPILTSQGRGSNVMIAMAIPCLGGMVVSLITLFIVPVLFSWKQEIILKNPIKLFNRK